MCKMCAEKCCDWVICLTTGQTYKYCGKYSQGTTEELRFFSLLQSLCALKHSTKRVLHWLSSWKQTKKKKRILKDVLRAAETSSPTRRVSANNVRQPGINSTSLHVGDERVKLGNKWHYVSNYFFPLLMLKEEQLDETFIKLCIAQRGWQTWLYYSLHQRHFQSSFFFSPWKWKATVDVANKLLIQRPPRIQARAVTAGLWRLVCLESSDSP